MVQRSAHWTSLGRPPDPGAVVALGVRRRAVSARALPVRDEHFQSADPASAAHLRSSRAGMAAVADLIIAPVAAVNRLPLYTTKPHDFVGLDPLVRVVAVPRLDGL